MRALTHEWQPADTKPAKDGVYETRFGPNTESPSSRFSYFKDGRWGLGWPTVELAEGHGMVGASDDIQDKQWRTVAKHARKAKS